MREIVSFALQKKVKAIFYSSSINAVFPGMVNENGQCPDDTLPQGEFSMEYKGTGRYTYGYAYSKLAAEMLLLNANKKYGLPVKVFRLGIIMGKN